MAKKDKNKKSGTAEKGAEQPAAASATPGMPGYNAAGATATAFNTQVTQTTQVTKVTTGKDAKKNKKAETQTKDQLEAFKKKNAGVDLSKLTPDQLAQLQLEEAIKESSNPAANLTKLRNPLGIRGCLLNLLFFIILTLAVVILICYIQIDNFNLGVVLKDMLTKFQIWQFFSKIFKTIGGWFTPKSMIGFLSFIGL